MDVPVVIGTGFVIFFVVHSYCVSFHFNIFNFFFVDFFIFNLNTEGFRATKGLGKPNS